MSKFSTIFLLCLIHFGVPGNLLAQADKARQLEEQLRGAEGQHRVEILLALADAQLYAGDYAKAISTADDAGDLAAKLKLPELRANALNREGKAMMLSGKRKAAGQFEQSLKILRDTKSSNKTLALDNLGNLRSLAERAGRDKEMQVLDEQIAQLRGGGNNFGANSRYQTGIAKRTDHRPKTID